MARGVNQRTLACHARYAAIGSQHWVVVKWRYQHDHVEYYQQASQTEGSISLRLENSSVVDIAPVEGAMVGIAGAFSQKFTVEKRHLLQEIELQSEVEVLAEDLLRNLFHDAASA